jgi:cell division protein FtsA
MKRKDNIVVGLDIGTTKTCCIVGEETEHGVEIVGIGTAPSRGLRKGVVINIDATVASIKKAVEEAEHMAGCEINTVYAGIAGGHIKSLNSHGIVAIKDREVSDQDIVRVLDAAQAIAIPMDREVIHIIPQEYIIDDQDGIRDPRGMSGVRLAAKVHIVTGAVTSAQNIIKCCHRTGLNVKDIVLEQLASSEAVLSPDEKELGVMLVDIGGGTTDIAIFANGSVQHTAVLSLGGDHVTRDIAIGLGTPTGDAELIKQRYGCAMTQLVDNDEPLDIPGVGGRKSRLVSRRMLAEIIEPRVEEMFGLVAQELARSGLEDMLPGGVVITGGSTILPGMTEIAERVFGMGVRQGLPRGISGHADMVSSPILSTAIGLVLFGMNKARAEDTRFKIREDNLYRRVKSRMGEWIGNIF